MRKLLRNPFAYISFVLMMVVGFQVLNIAGAQSWTWQPPTENFPAGNTAPPIDAGSGAQRKAGNFSVGNADQYVEIKAGARQLYFRGSGSESGSLFLENGTGRLKVTDSAGTFPLSPLWGSNGDKIYYNRGNVGIGINNPSYPLHVSATTSDVNSGKFGIYSTINNNATDLSISSHKYSVFGRYEKTGVSVDDGYQMGAVWGEAWVRNGTQKYLDVISARGVVAQSGNITNLSNFKADAAYNSSARGGTITNRYGLNVADIKGTGSDFSVTNQYGVYINPLWSGATNNFSIYAAGTSTSFLGGPLKLGELQGGSIPTAAKGVIYFDKASSKFRCSEDGANFVNCISSGSSGGGGESYWKLGTGGIHYTDTINKNVGVGIDTPITPLHVKGLNTASPDGDSILTVESSAANAYINFKTPGGKAEISGTGGQLLLGGSAAEDIIFRNSNYTERMRIDANGNVGIGTTSPGNRLTVYGGNMQIKNGNIFFDADEIGPPRGGRVSGTDDANGFSNDSRVFYRGSFLTNYQGETFAVNMAANSEYCRYGSSRYKCLFSYNWDEIPSWVTHLRIYSIISNSNELPNYSDSNWYCRQYPVNTSVNFTDIGNFSGSNCSEKPKNYDSSIGGFYTNGSPIMRFSNKAGVLRIGILTEDPQATLDVNGSAIVNGMIESKSGGFKFPDGTIQKTAAKAGKRVFTSDGTFTVPDGITKVYVSMSGGGGGGGYGGVQYGGGGGGGGEAIIMKEIVVSPGESINVLVGTGGVGATNNNAMGSDGGNSKFLDVIVQGGKKGKSFTGASNGAGGGGISGGVGGSRGANSTIHAGGGGGGSIFGSGGVGALNTDYSATTIGADGSGFGGGGGGGANGKGGNGSPGLVIVEW